MSSALPLLPLHLVRSPPTCCYSVAVAGPPLSTCPTFCLTPATSPCFCLVPAPLPSPLIPSPFPCHLFTLTPTHSLCRCLIPAAAPPATIRPELAPDQMSYDASVRQHTCSHLEHILQLGREERKEGRMEKGQEGLKGGRKCKKERVWVLGWKAAPHSTLRSTLHSAALFITFCLVINAPPPFIIPPSPLLP